MERTMNRSILVFMSVILSPAALADEHAPEESEEKVCISSNLVRNFDGLTDQHVFVEERSKQYYLLTMRHRCTGLRNAQAIGLKDATSRICSGGFGEVVLRERGIGPNRCRIEMIERVENKDEARAIIDEDEADRLRAADAARLDAITVDEFPPESFGLMAAGELSPVEPGEKISA